MMFDVAVIGAGPGGAITAKTCANNKLKTILIEKKPLPRNKPCGGCLTFYSLRTIRENFGEIPQNLVENRIEEVILLPDCQLRQPAEGISVYRKYFDYWLTQKAAEAGAVIYNATLTALSRKQDHVVMKLKRKNLEQKITAKFVVGADGVGSTVLSFLYPNLKRKLVQTHQVYIEGQLPRNAFYAYFPLEERGVTYFWVIPKKEIVVAGVGGLPPINLRRHMQNFLSMLKVKYNLGKIVKYETYPIPTFSPANLALGRGRILLVGDAASLVDPFYGEGIYSSLVSGKLASETIIKNFNEPSKLSKEYRKRLKPLLTELKEMHKLTTYYQSLDFTGRQNFLKELFKTHEKPIKCEKE